MTSPSTLLKNGTVLIHNDNDHVEAVKKDILIRGNKIVDISSDISSKGENVEIVDCTDRIISPGFIDTHHHMWQTQLKGRHANELLIDYMAKGNWQSSTYGDADFFWGSLGGCLEALWAGTTTVLEHAHLNVRAEATKAGLSGTVSSGIRSIFGYCPTMAIKKWNPIEFDYGFMAPWVHNQFEELAKASPYADGRVQIGLAFDLYFLPKEQVQAIFQKAADLGVKTITSHAVSNAQFSLQSLPEMLESYGLLNPGMVLSHANGASESDIALLKKRNVYFSSTPSTEMQMALGRPITFDDEAQSQASFGIDCHSNQLGSVISEMRLGLQEARSVYNQKFIDKQVAPVQINKTTHEAFNIGTIQGARALQMQDSIGSIAVGKLADLVIFDATTPTMVCAADHDPVTAIVMHSTPGDIEGVLVDGIWRKRDGQFASVMLERDLVARDIAGTDPYEWKDVAAKLRESRKELQAKIDKIDFVQARDQVFESFHIDRSKIVDKI